MRHLARILVVGAIVLFPVLGHAQELTGTFRDASGAVLPGVTVEAASPVLIEKVRTAVTDGNGNYSLVNLTPPGPVQRDIYAARLFRGQTRRRRGQRQPDGISINTEMRVGGYPGNDYGDRRNACCRRAEHAPRRGQG